MIFHQLVEFKDDNLIGCRLVDKDCLTVLIHVTQFSSK